MTESESQRLCLCDPIPEIAEAARYLDGAVSAHLSGDFHLAEELIRRADMRAIRDWTESLWGPKSPHKKFRIVPNAPLSVPKRLRLSSRMPTTAEKHALLERDGYHCRFCGIPVIRGSVRRRIRGTYPNALPWGRTNPTQHAAFQAMWMQYDHILPHARGGDNSLANMVITCGPCNFGRADYTLDELGLADPITRESVRSAWDGLERFRSYKEESVVRRTKPLSSTPRENVTREQFLSSSPAFTVRFFEDAIMRSEQSGLEVVGTKAGLKIHARGQPAFLYFYSPAMYKPGKSVVEVYLTYLKGTPLADELRRRVSAVDHVIPAGAYSLRLFATNDSLASA